MPDSPALYQSFSVDTAISDLVKPYTEIGFVGTLSFFNTYVIDYEYTNVKYGELGESSDKYRTIEEHTHWLSFGIILDL